MLQALSISERSHVVSVPGRRASTKETSERYMLLIHPKEDAEAAASQEEMMKIVAGHRAVLEEATKRGVLRGAEPFETHHDGHDRASAKWKAADDQRPVR
jgi:hypothetical protein